MKQKKHERPQFAWPERASIMWRMGAGTYEIAAACDIEESEVYNHLDVVKHLQGYRTDRG